jgi:hypothetical protein
MGRAGGFIFNLKLVRAIGSGELDTFVGMGESAGESNVIPPVVVSPFVTSSNLRLNSVCTQSASDSNEEGGYLESVSIFNHKTSFLIILPCILEDGAKVFLESLQRRIMIPIDPFANHLETNGPLDNCIVIPILAFIGQLHKQLTPIPTIFIRNINHSIINRIQNLVELPSPLRIQRIRMIDERRPSSPAGFLGRRSR